MGAFMIIQADITDPEQFMEYAKRAPALIEKFGVLHKLFRVRDVGLDDHERAHLISPGSLYIRYSEAPSLQCEGRQHYSAALIRLLMASAPDSKTAVVTSVTSTSVTPGINSAAARDGPWSPDCVARIVVSTVIPASFSSDE